MLNVKLFALFLFATVVIVSTDTEGKDFDPWTPGPYRSKHHHFPKDYLNETGGFHHHHVDIWVPKTLNPLIIEDKYPVLYFLPGLTDLLPAWVVYHKFFEQIAQHGILVIAPWEIVPEVGVMDTVKATWLDDVIDYFDGNLANWLGENGLEYINPDLDNPFIAGHSSSCNQVVEYLKRGCGKFQGHMLFSPVDMAFTGMEEFTCITPGELLDYNTPTLIAMAALDPLLSNGKFINNTCAPQGFSNERFFDAMDGPTWFVNATDYGHGDFLDPFEYNVMEKIHFCATDANTDKDIYRRFVTGEIASFVEVVYKGNCDSMKYIADPSMMPITATSECNRCEVAEICGHPYCKHK